ncbi:serine-rich protein-related [Striga asiatica]|uniref:Serine-rich protein-related n=1 Tax=Striga asiatica TaxID=4170 RepID=A0A5A7QSZ0_STRAF|nr:serine-rich protein-related [Striga asiatica]
MCYPCSYWLEAHHSTGSSRIRREAATQPAMAISITDKSSAKNDDGSKKACVCSPTSHPGSFRCRQHHEEYYQWVSRFGSNPSQSNGWEIKWFRILQRYVDMRIVPLLFHFRNLNPGLPLGSNSDGKLFGSSCLQSLHIHHDGGNMKIIGLDMNGNYSLRTHDPRQVVIKSGNSKKTTPSRPPISDTVLEQQHHIPQNLHPIELERGVHVRRPARLDAPAGRRHVPQLLPPVSDRDEQGVVVQGVEVLIENPNREVHGDVYGDLGAGVEVEAVEAEADDGEVRVGGPEEVCGGDEEDDGCGGAEYAAPPCLAEEAVAVGRGVGRQNDDVLGGLGMSLRG